jgi:hypothetical protein
MVKHLSVLWKLSRCLIHNTHLGKILSFVKIMNLNNIHEKVTFDYYFLFNICDCNSGLALKKLFYTHNFVYFKREIFQDLRRKRKWALQMRHLLQMFGDHVHGTYCAVLPNLYDQWCVLDLSLGVIQLHGT